MKITMIDKQLLWEFENEIAAMEIEAARRFKLGNGPLVPDKLKRAYEERDLLKKQMENERITIDGFSIVSGGTKQTQDKISIFIDGEKGIYKIDGGSPYGIKGKRRDLVKTIYNNEIADVLMLKLLYKTEQLISQTISEINKLFRDKL